jgi:hypothetical protein
MDYNDRGQSSLSHLYATIQGTGHVSSGTKKRIKRADGGPAVKKPMLGQDGHGRRRSGVEEMPHPVTRREMMENWTKKGKTPPPDIQAKIDKYPNYKKGGGVKRQKHGFGDWVKSAADRVNQSQYGVLNHIPGIKNLVKKKGGACRVKRKLGGPMNDDKAYYENHKKMKAEGKRPVYANGLSEQENGAFGKRAISYKAKGGEMREKRNLGGLMERMKGNNPSMQKTPRTTDRFTNETKQHHNFGDSVKGAFNKVKEFGERVGEGIKNAPKSLSKIKLKDGGKACRVKPQRQRGI